MITIFKKYHKDIEEINIIDSLQNVYHNPPGIPSYSEAKMPFPKFEMNFDDAYVPEGKNPLFAPPLCNIDAPKAFPGYPPPKMEAPYPIFSKIPKVPGSSFPSLGSNEDAMFPMTNKMNPISNPFFNPTTFENNSNPLKNNESETHHAMPTYYNTVSPTNTYKESVTNKILSSVYRKYG